MKGIVSTVKGVSNKFEFMSSKYNLAGVQNYSLKDNQYIIVNSDFDATMDVEVLASAFNMDKADFMGHRILIDSFGNLDTARLDELFKNDPNYTTLTSAELTALDAIPAVLVDIDWFMIYDNLIEFTENYNGQGLYWNYFYHCWKTFSVSPFSNSAVFVPGAPSITSVTVSPDTATVMPGQTLLLSATVVTQNFASKAVEWDVAPTTEGTDDIEGVTINVYGELTIPADIDAGTSITVTAKSVADSTKTDTAVITVYDPND